jgi:NAD(P)H-hydrate epimerase
MTDPGSGLSRQQARDIDRRAIDEYGLTGLVLMENAGRGCAELLGRLGITGPVCIVTGTGNNGGDGYVIARHLANLGHTVRVVSAVDPSRLESDAAVNHRAWVRGGGLVEVVTAGEWEAVFGDCEWIVDALLGTGVVGAVRPPYDQAIDAINRSSARVLAIDLPSGLDCDTGEILGRCVRADQTATMVAAKTGMLAECAVAWIGEVHVVDIGIPRSLRQEVLR